MKNNDIAIITIKGKDYQLSFRYNAIKKLQAKFGLSLDQMDTTDFEMIGKILYCSIKGYTKSFTSFENDLEDLPLGDLLKVVSTLTKGLQADEEEVKPEKGRNVKKKI